MMQYTTDLLDYFTGLEQNLIRRFCKQINETDADVIILMAHKAVRLFWVLVEQGYITVPIEKKIVISNHAVEFNCEYLKEKKIAIVDDIVISGSSIASLVSSLKSADVRQEDISIIVIATDRHYFAMNFDTPDGSSALYSGNKLDDAACIELSAKISKVFSHYGIPYEADFPTYTCTTKNEDAFGLFHDSFLWNVYDVSNENQRIAHVSAYSIQPAPCLRRKLWTLLGVDLDRCVHLVVRCYIKRFPQGTVNWCFLPLCLFEEITERDLEIVYKALKPSKEILNIKKDNNAKAKMRYLQFYIAHQLFIVFQELIGMNLQKEPNYCDGLQLFGPHAGKIVWGCFNEPQSIQKGAPLKISRREDLAEQKVKEFKMSKFFQEFKQKAEALENKWPAEQNFWLNHLVLSPFLWWYNDRELPARQDLLESKFHYVENQDKIGEITSRLHNGVSFATIRHILRDQFQDIPPEDIEASISLFLDRGIDEGVIVPAVYDSSMDPDYIGEKDNDDHYLCRIYRHGEDLPFAEADQYRLIFFLNKLAEKIPDIAHDDTLNIINPGISQIALQKMMVLFYRMGLAQGGVFNRFLGFGNYKILHSFMCLHGAVAGFTDYDRDPNMYVQQEQSVEYITLLSNWLIKNSILTLRTQNAESSETSVGGPNTICSLSLNVLKKKEKEGESVLGNNVKAKITSIANIIATWWKADIEKGSKSSFKERSTAVTSCGDIYIYASAIATEVHYFSLFWQNQVKRALQRESVAAIRNAFKEREGKIDHSKYTNDISQGLNSGRDKVDWFQDGIALETIEEVSDLLEPDMRSLWLSTWSNYEPTYTRTTKKIKDDTNLMVGYLYFFSACFECVCSENFWQSGELPEHFEEFREKGLKYGGARLDDNFANLYSAAECASKTVYQRGQDLYRQVCRALRSSEIIVNRIQDYVRGNAPNFTMYYKSALIFEVDPLNQNTPDEVFLEFWESYTGNIEKTELNIIHLPQQENSRYMRYGIFCNAGSPDGNGMLDSNRDRSVETTQETTKELHETFEKLCKCFTGRAYGIRAIILPDMLNSTYFEHDLKRNIEKSAKDFYKRYLEQLQGLYSYANLSTRQLVFVCCNYCDVTLTTSPQFHPISGVVSPDWCAKCEVYDNGVVTEEEINGHIVENSMVRLACKDKDSGWGFLLKIQDRVVCITCNHVIRWYQNGKNPIQGKLAMNSSIQFQLEPMTPIPKYKNMENPELKHADQEIAILQLCWDGEIPMDLHIILSEDNLYDGKAYTKIDECRRANVAGRGRIQWDSIHVPKYMAGEGYLQADDLNVDSDGASGGIYASFISPNTPPVIIGMHCAEYGGDHRSLVIPGDTISKFLRGATEKWKEDKNKQGKL